MATDPRITTGGTIPPELPEVDPEGILAETQATINAIDSEEAIKAKATRAARDKDAPKAVAKRRLRRDTPLTQEGSARRRPNPKPSNASSTSETD